MITGARNFYYVPNSFAKTNHKGNCCTSHSDFSPSVNLKQNPENFIVEVSAAGFQKSDFKIDLEQNKLNISAEVQKENVDNNEKYSLREFYKDSFKRSFSLPENADKENISAKYENGILSVYIPKFNKNNDSLSKEISVS